MRKFIFPSFYLILITAILSAANFAQAQVRPYRVSDSQVQYLLNRIEQKTDTYKRSMDTALDRSRLDGSDTEDMIMDYIMEFENATDQLKQRFDARESVNTDVEEVLSRAANINAFMQRNRLNAVAQRNWANIRTDLNTLARYYSVSWSWTNPAVRTPSNRAYRVSDNNVQGLLTRLESKTDTFKRTMDRSLDRSRIGDTNAEDRINDFISEFENATDRLKQRFDARESASSDVEDVLMRANSIEAFLKRNRLNRTVQTQWDSIKFDLNTLAGYYNVASWDWNRSFPNRVSTPTGNMPYAVTDKQVQALLSNIEYRTDRFKNDMSYAIDRSTIDGTRSETVFNNYLSDFEKATDRLKQNFDARRSTNEDVTEVLNRAYFIDSFMRDYRFATTAERNWMIIRNDLNTLSEYYRVAWNWDRQYVPPTRFDQMLTGTYRLNASESDNVATVVERAIGYYNANQRDERLKENLKRRLDSPEMIAIEKRGNDVTVASSNAPQITFTADNVRRTETTNGRTINVTARTYYDGVAINYEGDRMNDFYVNFMPLSDGKLKVVRRVYLENRNETVTVASVYDRIAETAQWTRVDDRNYSNTGTTVNDFYVPNGTNITARLNNMISTESSQDGDRFSMTITSPNQFDGAVIEGRVLKAEKSGRVSGRANLTLDFDTIRLRNGQTYRFAGIIENVTTTDGENVSVNNEGVVRDSNQTKKTVTRAGIGAALGALIGAIAGGGEGAAIGAAIGAGAGAGTIFIQGRDNIELKQGSQFTITSSAPANVGSR